RQEPRSLLNLQKRYLDSGEEELACRLDHYEAKARPRIFLIWRSWNHVDSSMENEHTLKLLGHEQTELTGLWLASLGLKFNKIVHSAMSPEIETTDISNKHLPGICKVSTDLLREGTVIETNPPMPHWKPEAVFMKMEPGSRLPSGTASTGQTPSVRRAVRRSSPAMPASSADGVQGASVLP
ncbi:unnamed protein product, partial [Gulo gulo]